MRVTAARGGRLPLLRPRVGRAAGGTGGRGRPQRRRQDEPGRDDPLRTGWRTRRAPPTSARLVRFGQHVTAGRDRRCRCGGRQVSRQVGYQPGEPKRVLVDGAPIESVGAAARPVPCAGVHPRPACGWCRAAPALRRSLFRSGAGPPLARPASGAAPSTRGRWCSETTCCAGCVRRPAPVDALDPLGRRQAARRGRADRGPAAAVRRRCGRL